jgi:hypothetical protein
LGIGKIILAVVGISELVLLKVTPVPKAFLPFTHCRFYSLSQCGRAAIIAFDFFWQPTLNGFSEKSFLKFY